MDCGCDGGLKGCTGCICSALCHSMVAITELELDNVAYSGRHRVGYEGILRSTNDNRNNPVSCRDCMVLVSTDTIVL